MTDEPELNALIDEVRSGDHSAFAKLVTRVQARVQSWAMRFADDPDEADDIAQGVLIGLERGVRQYRGRSRFSTWLFAVTRNAAFNHRREDVRRAALRAERDMPGRTSAEVRDTHDERAAASLVLRYFDELPPRQRQIFELVDLRGESPVDVARTLGMRPVTVRAHLFKARRAIRARLLELHEPFMSEFLS